MAIVMDTDETEITQSAAGGRKSRKLRPYIRGIPGVLALGGNGKSDMETFEIRQLVLDRRAECGVGLCGSYMAIVRWLMREHGILTTESWVASVINETRQRSQQKSSVGRESKHSLPITGDEI